MEALNKIMKTNQNKIKSLLSKPKTQKQIYKLLLAANVGLVFLLAVEIIFHIPCINQFFSSDSLKQNMNDKVGVWVILWILMFAQVAIIPMPAMPIYVFCNSTTLVASGSSFSDLFSLQTVFFLLFIVSACVCGSISAYVMGKLFGKKAVKWIAGDEEEYQEWCVKLNCKMGKWIYGATVLLPIFPDDILCIVVGSLGMDFKFFCFVNTVGRVIGSSCILMFMRLPITKWFFTSSTNGGFPWALVSYIVALIFTVSASIVWKKKVINKMVQ